MNDRLRQALAWMAVAAIVFFGLLLLYYVAVQGRSPTDSSSPGLSWPALQTIVAFALFDVALIVGLVAARLGSWPAKLSARALWATGASMALLSLVILIVLDWQLTLAGLLWTLVLIAGFALLLSIVNTWLVFWAGSEPIQSVPDTGAQEPLIDDFPVEPPGPPPPEPSDGNAGDAMAYLIALLNGDRETAERLVAMERTLDPGASNREAIARAAYRLVRGQA